MNENSNKKYEINYHQEFIEAYNLTEDSMLKIYDELMSILKGKFELIVPLNLDGIGNIPYLLELHNVFSQIKNINGFDRHLKIYDKDVASSFFVSKMGLALQSIGMEVTFEPEVTSKTGRNPDIQFCFNDQTIYMECKTIFQNQFIDSKRHAEIFDLVEEHINFPHEISISYTKDLQNEQFEAIGESIEKMLPKVTTNGKIISNQCCVVEVKYKAASEDSKLIIISSGINRDELRLPFTSFSKGGKTIIFYGPQVNYEETIKNKVDDARTQSIDGFPFIVAINSDFFLGNDIDNRNRVARLFQPERNTRISGVLFVESDRVHFDEYINNPYATHPVLQRIQDSFKNKH